MIVLAGFVLATLFTWRLWKSRGSLTSAAGSVIVLGALALLAVWTLGQPWAVTIISEAVRLRDEFGGSDPKLVIWAVVLAGAFGLVWRSK